MNAPASSADRAAWRSIVDAALRAPWADNRPAMRLHWRADACTLEWHTTELDVWRVLPHRRWLALLAFGAALENARLRAATLGRVLEHEMADAAAWPCVARSRLVAAGEPGADEASLAAAIEARCTNRRFYRREPLDTATRRSIEDAAGGALHWVDAAPAQRIALRMLRIAEAERFSQWRLHNELFASIRFDLGWQKSAAHGLPPAALEIEPPMRGLFAALRDPRLARAAAALGAPRALAWRAAGLPCALAPHLAVLATPRTASSEPAAPLAAGRALQRAWLAAAHADVALQPFAACGALLRQVPGDGWVRAATQEALQRGVDALWPALALDATRDLQIFLRIGKSAPPSLRTSREDVSRMLPSALENPPG